MATINLGRIKPVFRGAYAGGTAYVVDDIVTSGNETFICILASTGNATSNATYWTKLAAKGVDGALGTNPQLSMTWDNATADADNGAGKIAWNHATIASATVLYVDDADDGSANIQPYVDTWDAVTNTTAKGIVTITKESTPATFATFKVSGAVVDATGYSKIPVTHLASNGTFSDADGVGVHFQYSGTDGADGTDVGTTITTEGDILYRDGSGLARLAKGSAADVLTMNAGATAPSWAAAAGGGKVLQVVQNFWTTQETTTSTLGSFSIMTDSVTAITPASTSNKVLVVANLSTGSSSSQECFIKLQHNGTGSYADKGVGTGASGSRVNISFMGLGGFGGNSTFCYLDSPSKDSAFNYQLLWNVRASGTAKTQTSSETTDASYIGWTGSSLTLIEIDGT